MTSQYVPRERKKMETKQGMSKSEAAGEKLRKKMAREEGHLIGA